MVYSKIINENLPKALYKISNKIINKGRGCWLYDIDGNKILDFTSGIGVTSLGHNNKEVINTVKLQLDNLIHGQMNCMYNEPMLKFTETLSKLMPNNLQSYFYTNSGSEAIENALKIAKITSNKTNIISFYGGFHGRTIGAASISTSKTIQRIGFNPLLSGIIYTKFPNFRNEIYKQADKDFLYLFKNVINTNDVAAIIIEPIQGEGGFNIANYKSLENIALFCKNNGIYLIIDEVQSGVGRTGKMFSYQNYNLEPDIVCIAKGIATGFPIGIVATSKEIMSKVPLNSIGGTYGGGPIVTAAANKTIEIINRDNICEKSYEKGKYLLDKLKILKNKYSIIKDIRGVGLMIAIEFYPEYKDIAKEISYQSEKNNLLLLTAGNNEVIRLLPPLIISYKEIHIALDILQLTFDNIIQKIKKKKNNNLLY